ncbi:MAG TPA: HRDC domain-containing protein [Candidatus Baltobacteraceae bacterium]
MSVTIVDTPEQLATLVELIDGAERVALDTEFHAERSYAARLMVLQLVVGEDVFIVDPLRIRELQPLAQALAKSTIVGHALQSDLRILVDRFDLLPAAAFDTQLAAAFCGYGVAISLADLVHDLISVRLRKSQTVSDWSTRPFTEQQIEYLVDDVRHLFPLEDRLREKLVQLERVDWFEEEARPLVDITRYRPDPERIYMRIPGALRMTRRELGILRELAQLRDELARERDVPPKYIIPDDVMSGIVHIRPRQKDELGQLRRLDAGLRKAFGDRIIAAVAAGIAVDDQSLPAKPTRPPGADREAIVACLNVLVNAIATEHDIPPSMLSPRSALERLARELPDSAEEVARVLEASPWRAHLVAEPLAQLLRGDVALAIAGGTGGSPRVRRVNLRAEREQA